MTYPSEVYVVVYDHVGWGEGAEVRSVFGDVGAAKATVYNSEWRGGPRKWFAGDDDARAEGVYGDGFYSIVAVPSDLSGL